MPDPFEEKSKRFLPAESYFWVLNTLGWIFTLSLMNPGSGLPENPDNGGFRFVVVAVIWLAYYALGTLTLLVFRLFYYRQRWYQKKFIGSLPLAILVALAGGMAIAALIVLPVGLMRESDFRIYNEAGRAVYEGAFATTLYAGYELAVILLFWLLGWLGIEGAMNANGLALKSLALENSLKDARLNALAGQINPHFLFNALNNIRFMIQRDAAGAQESLIGLSEILRYSLGTSHLEKTLLAQELVIVERYLSLMKVQMQHRLEYSIRKADVPENMLIPPMVIQMLVENAIKHGLEQIKEGGRIDVHCSMTAGKLQIEVRNSAVSVDPARRSVASLAAVANAGVEGLGLANIRNRLSLLYGKSATLSLFRQQDDFLARIVLPAEEVS